MVQVQEVRTGVQQMKTTEQKEREEFLKQVTKDLPTEKANEATEAFWNLVDDDEDD